MTPEEFRARLATLLSVARSCLTMKEVYDILGEEYNSLAGDIWLHSHYKGDPPPRLTDPAKLKAHDVVSPDDNQCSGRSNDCEQDEGA